jgi:plastocyanin
VTSGVSHPPDSSGRSATHPDGKFNSGDLARGAKFAFTFDRPGSYPYFCSRHPEGMRGEIVVH